MIITIALIGFLFSGSQDNHKKCKKWAENGKCSKNKVKRLCPKSCNLGGGGGGGGAGAGGGGGGIKVFTIFNTVTSCFAAYFEIYFII